MAWEFYSFIICFNYYFLNQLFIFIIIIIMLVFFLCGGGGERISCTKVGDMKISFYLTKF